MKCLTYFNSALIFFLLQWSVANAAPPLMYAWPLRLQAGFNSVASYSGTVEPDARTVLSFERGGQVQKLNVSEGDKVARGQLLASLDIRLLQNQIRQFEARGAEISAKLKLAKLNMKRNKNLSARGHASSEDVDRSEASFYELSAQLTRNKEELDAVKILIDHSRIIAPYEGVVTKRYLDAGQVVSVGEPIYEIVSKQNYEVKFGLPLMFVDTFKSKQAVDISIDDKTYTGHVRSINRDLSLTTKTVNLIVTFHSDQVLVTGDTARLNVSTYNKVKGIWLPLSALVQSYRGLWDLYLLAPLNGNQYKLSLTSINPIYNNETCMYTRPIEGMSDYALADGIHRAFPGLVVVAKPFPQSIEQYCHES